MFKPALLAATLALSLPSLAAAVPLTDAANDFIASYTGPKNGDLDVRSSEVFLGNGVFDFTASLGGNIGTTAGGFYVFGVNRGAGTARFASLGLNNVLFDAVVIINNNLTGSVRDLLTNTSTNLSSPAIFLQRRIAERLRQRRAAAEHRLRRCQLHLQSVAAQPRRGQRVHFGFRAR